MFIVISKPNKLAYNTLKTFCLIVLFNTLGKLIEKAIGERFQTHTIVTNFIYSNQLRGLKQYSTYYNSKTLEWINEKNLILG